jgi:hypothetical protein
MFDGVLSKADRTAQLSSSAQASDPKRHHLKGDEVFVKPT